MKRLSQLVLFLLLCTVLAGCSSYRFTTDIKKVAIKKPYPVQFRIEEIEYPFPSSGLSYQGFSTWVVEGYLASLGATGPLQDESIVKNALMHKSERRYPGVFSSQPDAVPIKIQFQIHRKDTWFYSYIFNVVTLWTMPFPSSEKASFRVSICLLDHSGTRGTRVGQTSFIRQDHAWQSFMTPIGLIPVPGETARPKVSEILWWNKSSRQGGDLTIESIVDAIAKVLQQRDLTPEIEEYIKSQRKF